MGYRIQPISFISEKHVMDYYYYPKKEAIKLYRNKFPQFKVKDIDVVKF